MTIQKGSKVLVKNNAYRGSTFPPDKAARGKKGIVVWMERTRIEVQTDDDYLLLLTLDEVEEIEREK